MELWLRQRLGQESVIDLKASAFKLCFRSTDIADAIEECAQQLRAQGVEFIAMDGELLSERLWQSPEIVADFFELAWVERFC